MDIIFALKISLFMGTLKRILWYNFVVRQEEMIAKLSLEL